MHMDWVFFSPFTPLPTFSQASVFQFSHVMLGCYTYHINTSQMGRYIVSCINMGNPCSSVWHTNVTTTDSLGTLRLTYIWVKGIMLPPLAQAQEVGDNVPAAPVTLRVSTKRCSLITALKMLSGDSLQAWCKGVV